MIFFQALNNYIARKKHKLIESINSIDMQYDALALFGLINFTVLYAFDEQYPLELLKFHWAGLALSTILLFMDFIPKKFQLYKKIYWYFCVWYILCFFSVSHVLFSYASAQSLLDIILCLFLLVVSTDWTIASFLLILGAACAAASVFLSSGVSMSWDYYLRGYNLLRFHYYMTFYFFWALLIATIFLKKIDKKKENYLLKRQLNVTQVIASSIAHELRTPLLTIDATIEGLKRFTPILIESYHLAKQQGLAVQPIPDEYYQALKNALDFASKEIVITNTIINILLVRLRGTYNDKTKIEVFPISECVNTAIERYPFDIEDQTQIIVFNAENDFKCRAVKLLLIHVLFNLLKNALYYVRKAGKGQIYIWLEQKNNKNYLYFKDTSVGINKKYLPYLFDEFYSMTENGTGVGLTFCKLVMEELGGKIKVESVEHEYTTFTLIFPQI